MMTPTQPKHSPRRFALIPAAGVGARMAAGGPKQYLNLCGKPILRHVLDAFCASPLIDHAYVVVSTDDAQIDNLMADLPADAKVTVLRCGGANRMQSVLNALAALGRVIDSQDWVLVHDAARPGLTPQLIEKLIDGVGIDPVGGLLALPVVDTVKSVAQVSEAGSGQGSVPSTVTTVPRAGLWLAQTPQMFRYQLLSSALAAAPDASAITDDASAIEAQGWSPKLIEGHPRNFKITVPDDLRIAEMYLAINL